MGGRGASSGMARIKRGNSKSGTYLIANWNSGYDNNGNANLQKWQNQTDENKAARYLAKLNGDWTIQNGEVVDANGNRVNDKFGFYDSEFQKFAMAMDMNSKPQVMNDKAFDAMVKAKNLQVLYRGESGQTAADRFMNADYNHTGAGSYGEGHYFSTEYGVAKDYAQEKSRYNGTGIVETMVLSPSARAIRYSDLQSAYNSLSPQLQRSLTKAGQNTTASYWSNGEAFLAAKLGYNVVAIDSFGGTYNYAIDRSAFIVKKTLERV